MGSGGGGGGRGGYAFRGAGESTMSKLFFPPSENGSENGSTLKGKNLLPKGANSYLLEQTLFLKGLDTRKSKQKVTKVVFLLK